MEKEQVEQKKQKLKIWTVKFWFSFVLLPIILLSIIGGSIFGLITTAKDEDLNISSSFKNQYQIQIHVDWNSSDKDIYYVSDYFSSQLKTIGLYDSTIDIIDSDDLMISFPISSIMNNDEEKYSLSSETDYRKELVYVEATLLNMSYVEFRTLDGAELFQEQDGKVVFVEPAPPDTGETGGGTTVPPSSSADSVSNLDQKDFQKPYETYDIQLINYAQVSYANGQPYVEIFPQDMYLSEFHQAADYLSSAFDQATNPTGSTYTVWFGYGLLEYMVEQYDPEGYSAVDNDLYTYIHTDSTGNATSDPIQVADPFFVTEGRVTKTQSKYKDSFGIYGDFSVNEANAIANQINFSNNTFDLSVVNQGLKFQTLNFKTLKWTFIVFTIIIILIAFFFVWWFGLLGMVTGVSSLLVGAILTLPLVFLGIPLSFMTLGIMVISLFLSFYVQYIILDFYKNKTLNKNTSSRKKTKQIFFRYSKKIFVPSFIVIFPLAVATFVLATTLQFYVYFFILAFMVIIGAGYLFYIPALFILDVVFKYSFRDEGLDQKWNFIIGVNSKRYNVQINEKFNLNALNEKATKKLFGISIITFTVLTVLSFGMLGAYQFLDSSGVNKLTTDGQFYQYSVMKTITPYDENSQNLNSAYPYSQFNADYDDNLDDRYNQQMMIDELHNDQATLFAIFEDNGISIDSYQVTRFEFYDVSDQVPPDGEASFSYDYKFSYGFTIYSDDQIDPQSYNAIQSSLSGLDLTSNFNLYDQNGDLIPSEGSVDQDYSYNYEYQLLDRGSLTNYSADSFSGATELTNYNYSVDAGQNTLAIFILYLVMAFVLLIFYRWATALAIIISSALESSVMFFLMMALFLPFTIAFWYVFIASVVASALTKVLITEYNNKAEDRSDLFINHNKSLLVLVFLSLLFTFNLIAIFFLGISVLISLIYLLVFPTILIYSDIFIYAYLVKYFNKIRQKRIMGRRAQDETDAKDENIISEEFIKGINK